MKTKGLIWRLMAIACCVAIGLTMVGCNGGDDVSDPNEQSSGGVTDAVTGTVTGSGSTTTAAGGNTGASTIKTTMKTSGGTTADYADETAPNKPVRVPGSPDKPVIDPTTLCAYGAAAPKWMREAEMYTHGTYAIPGHFDYDLKTWAPYFNFITGSAWNTDVNNTYRELWIKSDSYFDPYHVFSDKTVTVQAQNGEFVQSDYIEPGRNDLYVVCHNCPEVTLPWCYEYIDRAMSFGQTGMFFDDIRAPYDSIAEAYNTCYSKNHKHTLTGNNTSNYFGSTLPSIYQYVKNKNPDYYVLLNGGNPLAAPTDVSTAQNVWPFADALMWEHAIYDSLTKKWCSWSMLKQASELLAPGIANGKVELLLSYSYDKMDKKKAMEAAVYTLAYCRLYDYAWSDYNTMLTSPLGLDLVKEIYGTKTGPAGAYGTFYGRVVEENTGAGIVGATVKAGGVKTTTDQNGNFSIKVPANTTTVELSRKGYETVSRKLTGYKDTLAMKKTAGTVYYVSPYGSNDNDGTSPVTPWRSINCGDAKKLLVPGDTVVLMEGTYSVPNQTVYSCSGTAENPITYVAKGNVTIRTAAGEGIPFVLKGSYMVWEGISFEGSSQGVRSLMTVNGKGCNIRGCEFNDTAFFNADKKLAAESAVTIRGEGTKFHHNVLGSDIYAPVALLVETGTAEIAHNTFDGAQVGGGKAAVAVKLTKAGKNVTVKNNLFTSFKTAFASGSAGAVFGGNFFHATERGEAGCTGEKDVTGKAPQFMWQPTGDYDLKRDSGAVNAGVDAGYAYRGSAPDIGAYETAFNEHYDAVENGRVMVRTFANTVVLMNTSKARQTVVVSLDVAGAKLREAVTGGTWTADGNGFLQVTVPADGALILVGQ